MAYLNRSKWWLWFELKPHCIQFVCRAKVMLLQKRLRSKRKHVISKLGKLQEDHKLHYYVEEHFGGGSLLIWSFTRPSQFGRAGGYILEGKK
ncbi:hypothetical protein IFM89_025901 [Coptis chinensis]|uniref:Uncharacterized protein n=1 Tax=Coptis chinensis TaxID=261450 RepID=A0A835HY53_9MAGN|nr:hypothetical protein IFM89_025901 [Coptis chinensis]